MECRGNKYYIMYMQNYSYTILNRNQYSKQQFSFLVFKNRNLYILASLTTDTVLGLRDIWK